MIYGHLNTESLKLLRQGYMMILLPSIDPIGVCGVSMVKCTDYPFQRLHGDHMKHLNLSMLIFVCHTRAPSLSYE
jgi:hypothetical protein